MRYDITNNHAFRKCFNMWLVEYGIEVADRAKILGHSVDTNLKHYTVQASTWIEDGYKTVQKHLVTTGDHGSIEITSKKKSPKPA